jgi:sugar/nucleoside kinase (ribokinase family)
VSRSRSILVLGDVVTDVVVRPLGPLQHGTDTPSAIMIGGGGSAANTAAWAAACGADVAFVGRVGRDQAAWHIDLLAEVGMRAYLAVDDEFPTARIVVLVDGAGERAMLTDRGANDRLVDGDLDDTLLAEAGIVHVSGYSLSVVGPRRVAQRALLEAHRGRSLTSVDPNSVSMLGELGVSEFLRLTDGVDLCFPNADEACALTGFDDPRAAAVALTSTYATVVCKLGPNGAVVASGGAIVAEGPAVATTVVDTTGAGDAFAGAYLAGLAAGSDGSSPLTQALAAASLAVGRVGGRPPRPS